MVDNEEEKIKAIKEDLLTLCQKHQITLSAFSKYDEMITVKTFDESGNSSKLFAFTFADPEKIYEY